MKMEYLDNGFYTISEADARKVCGGKLPRPGHEKLVPHEGKHWWVARTPHFGKMLWSIREAKGWKLDSNGNMVRT